MGLLADTHVPDKLARLPSGAIELLRNRSVDAILHAGDICRPGILTELTGIAPVVAVRGNRDTLWPGNWKLPTKRVIEFCGVRIGLAHGHPGPFGYVCYKLGLRGRDELPEEYERVVVNRFSESVSVVVYGHSHVPRIARVGGILVVNPGSLAPPHYTEKGATMAILNIADGPPAAEIVSVR